MKTLILILVLLGSVAQAQSAGQIVILMQDQGYQVPQGPNIQVDTSGQMAPGPNYQPMPTYQPVYVPYQPTQAY